MDADGRAGWLRRGARAETMVVEYLLQQGYRIIDRNVRSRFGELDIIAERGDVVAFVEVRMRKDTAFDSPLSSVNEAKRRKVVKTATAYCLRHNLFARSIRFDVASVVGESPRATIEHIEDAFQAWF